MDDIARGLLDVRADTIALRAAVKLLLRRSYGMGDQALGIIREDALAAVEAELGQDEQDDLQQYFHKAVREAIEDLLTPLPR